MKKNDEQYHYGKIYGIHKSKDGLIRKVDIEYKNSNEETEGNSSGCTRTGYYFPVDELDIYEQIDRLI